MRFAPAFGRFFKGLWRGHCSETRDGRNPQHTCGSVSELEHCSETRDGRNPQQDDPFPTLSRHCSETRDGRNPQHSVWGT